MLRSRRHASEVTQSPPSDIALPRTIDSPQHRYRVVRLLGAGSFAETFACERESDGKRVAIKELRVQNAGSWKPIELFEREVKVLAALRHPSIPALYESFEARDTNGQTTLCLAQELVEGDSLKQRITVGPLLGEAEVYTMALALLDVLEYLHGRVPSVFHRDLKPSNILLRPDGSTVLIDFGGVCFGWRPPDYSGTTVVGTFGYMPPEQLMGQVGPTADLYALGATLLHAVTGTPPHEFPFDTGRIEVPRDLSVRPTLRRLIHELLHGAPRDRPQSVAAARAILLDEKGAAASSASRALARRPESRALIVASADSPSYVELPPAPRAIKGEYRDVYEWLIAPGWSGIIGQTPAAHIIVLVLMGVLAASSLGVVPLIVWAIRSKRQKRYDPLWTHGVQTEGVVVASDYDYYEMMATFTYEYEVDGQLYRAVMESSPKLRRYFIEGTRVAVLYDEKDPSHSCFIFRKRD